MIFPNLSFSKYKEKEEEAIKINKDDVILLRDLFDHYHINEIGEITRYEYLPYIYQNKIFISHHSKKNQLTQNEENFNLLIQLKTILLPQTQQTYLSLIDRVSYHLNTLLEDINLYSKDSLLNIIQALQQYQNDGDSPAIQELCKY